MKKLFLLILVLSMAFAGLFSIRHIGNLYAGEDNNYTMVVSNAASGMPVAGASVNLYKGDNLLGERMTNATGYASFLLHPKETGTVAFSITKKGYNEYVLFQNIVARPTPTPMPSPSPTATSAPTNTTAKLTGFIILNPSDKGLFLFVMLLAFVSLFASSYLYYKNFLAEGENMDLEEDDSAWESAEAYSVAGMGKVIKKLNNLQ